MAEMDIGAFMQTRKLFDTPPQWLEDYRVCLVDASDYSKQGSFNVDFRFHPMVELFTLNMGEFHFTEVSEDSSFL